MLRPLLFSAQCVFVLGAFSQSVTPVVISGCGGSSVVPGVGSVQFTVGEPATTSFSNGTNMLTQGFHQGAFVRVRLNIKAFLQGPWTVSTPPMTDGLRTGGWIPASEPYTALGYPAVAGAGGETVAPAVLAVTGANAIVDWVYLQLRDKNTNTLVVASCRALIQRDGDIVATDGVSPVTFYRPSDNYFLSVQHRNHLSILTLNSIALTNTPVSVNLTNGTVATYGTNAQRISGAARMLWAGDVTDNEVIKYAGSANDRDPILTLIGGSVPTATTTGYHPHDVTLDGTVKYAGSNNDRDVILQNIGGSVPTATRTAQMP
ncbi:MAG: hypothetical protein KA175_15855 [Flavobacteriales bacterium]|nr:hypothetical protein [Flavobacteriales bacterium]